jgi:hypothetical protein
MIEYGDRWSLSSDDATVTRISLDWGVTLTIGSTEPQIDVRIEQPFELTDPSGTSVRLVPEGDTLAMSPVLRMSRRTVERMDAFNDGRLEIAIADGMVVRVESSDAYEAWEISGSGGFRIVSTPGGGLAVWKAASS